MSDPKPSASPGDVTVTTDPQTLASMMALGGGTGAVPTSQPDEWGTGQYGDQTVIVGRAQSGGPLEPTLTHRKTGYVKGPYKPLTFTDQTSTVDEVLRAGYQLSSDALKTLQQKLWLAGAYKGTDVTAANQIPYGTYDEATIAAYANVLTLSAQQHLRGLDNTWTDTLDGLIKQRTATGQTGAGKSSSYTQTSYDISDPDTAKSILSNVFQAYMGVGEPDADTVSAFQAALNSYEKSHPSVTTSTTSGDQTKTSSTSNTGGLTQTGRDQFAQDWLFQQNGAQVANYQAATTYYNAALKALASPVKTGSNG